MQEKVKQMEKEIENKRKMSTEVKNKMYKKIFINAVLTIAYMLFMIITNLLYLNVDSVTFTVITKFTSVFSMFVTVILFENAYYKEKIDYFFDAIELLILSIIFMYIPYVYINMPENTKKIIMLTPVYYAVYYIVKSSIIVLKTKKDYINSLSDVKEIVKDEEKGYLEEDSKKIIKEINELEARKQEEKKIIKEAKKKQKQIQNKEASENTKNIVNKEKINKKKVNNNPSTKLAEKIAKDEEVLEIKPVKIERKATTSKPSSKKSKTSKTKKNTTKNK